MRKDNSYKYTLEMEYVRECQWRNTSQGKFESSMLSLDALVASFDKPDHIAVFSDRGAGVKQIAAHDDERERERRIAAALEGKVPDLFPLDIQRLYYFVQ